MILSAKAEYAIVALLELSLRNGQGPLQTRSISKTQRIPLRFLEQVLTTLKKGSLVESLRGAQGGYILARLPEEITVGQVVEVVEGPIISENCTANGTEPCWHELDLGYCFIKEMRHETKKSLLQAMDSLTLKDLCELKKQREQKSLLMYHI